MYINILLGYISTIAISIGINTYVTLSVCKDFADLGKKIDFVNKNTKENKIEKENLGKNFLNINSILIPGINIINSLTQLIAYNLNPKEYLDYYETEYKIETFTSYEKHLYEQKPTGLTAYMAPINYAKTPFINLNFQDGSYIYFVLEKDDEIVITDVSEKFEFYTKEKLTELIYSSIEMAEENFDITLEENKCQEKTEVGIESLNNNDEYVRKRKKNK